MDVGVGLNSVIPGTRRDEVLAWARLADEGPLSTLGAIDRMTYPAHEPLVGLAVVAGATRRVRLMTTVLVAPQRNSGVLARQALTLDALSGGRLSLGIGIGSRPADYRAAGTAVEFGERAERVEEQLEQLRRTRVDGRPGADGDPTGPPPGSEGGYEILYGGYSEAAARRAGRLADGFLGGNLPPEAARDLHAVATAARREAGREGRPRFVLCGYWCLGPGRTRERGRSYLRDYYAFAGGQMVARTLGSVLEGRQAVEDRLDACEDAGVDEVVLWPTVPDPGQLEGLADLLSARG